MDGETLRDGIFALRTRRIGSVAECMIMRLLKYSKGRSLFHDLYDDQLNHRIEVKFSVVQKKAEITVTEETVLRCIEEAVAENRYGGIFGMEAAQVRLQHPASEAARVRRALLRIIFLGLCSDLQDRMPRDQREFEGWADLLFRFSAQRKHR
jgi:hypothetical protein